MYDQFCAVARAAEVLGERWTVLVIRELLLGPKRYSDLLRRLEPIAPAILSGRLKDLEARGIIERVEVPPPTPAKLFRLTESGLDLEPVLREMLKWGARYLSPPRPRERFEPDWLGMVLLTYARRDPIEPVQIVLELEHEGTVATFTIEAGPDGTAIRNGSAGEGSTVRADVRTVLGVLSGKVTIDAAVAQGRAQVAGSLKAARRLPGLFSMVSGD